MKIKQILKKYNMLLTTIKLLLVKITFYIMINVEKIKLF